jgi:hypothetical protein
MNRRIVSHLASPVLMVINNFHIMGIFISTQGRIPPLRRSLPRGG